MKTARELRALFHEGTGGLSSSNPAEYSAFCKGFACSALVEREACSELCMEALRTADRMHERCEEESENYYEGMKSQAFMLERNIRNRKE